MSVRDFVNSVGLIVAVMAIGALIETAVPFHSADRPSDAPDAKVRIQATAGR